MKWLILPGLVLIYSNAVAGPWYSPQKKISSAEVIVEIELGPGRQERKLKEVLRGSPDLVDSLSFNQTYLFSPQSGCWQAMKKHHAIQMLLFYRYDTNGNLTLYSGVENNLGFYTSFNPSYSQLKNVIVNCTKNHCIVPDEWLVGQSVDLCGLSSP